MARWSPEITAVGVKEDMLREVWKEESGWVGYQLSSSARRPGMYNGARTSSPRTLGSSERVSSVVATPQKPVREARQSTRCASAAEACRR